jgi:hypothetical protein
VKSIKMLGLAAFAALMAMALLGASSAVAGNTQLCKADENPCAAANVISHVHEETLAGQQATLLTSLGNVSCATTLFLGLTLGLGAPLVIHGNFTFSTCKRGGVQNCTVIEDSTDSLLEVLRTGHETASVTYEIEVKVECGLFIQCVFDTHSASLVGTAKGPLLASSANGEVVISDQAVSSGGPICPMTKKLDIVTHPLVATYIST